MAVIDFTRAFATAWERMTVILFQPFDAAKWGLIGFNAFLALLAEGGVSLTNPFPSSQKQNATVNITNYTDFAHQLERMRTWMSALPTDPWFKIYVCLIGAYIIIWLVLNWVGCRGEFVFLDNIVRNRGALQDPWKRYAPQGNAWFLFHTGLVLVTYLLLIGAIVGFLALNWTWLGAKGGMSGFQFAGLFGLVFLLMILIVLGLTVVFLIRSLALPLYFKQTMSLASALVATMTLVVTRPLSIFVYVLLSLLLAFAAAIGTCFIGIFGCCLIACVSCYPFIGSLLVSMVICQVILPYLVFARCFQLGCLAEFGPQYDVFRVDAPTVPPLA